MQGAKLNIIDSAATLGYTPISTPVQVSRLLKDIYAHAYLASILNDQPTTMSKLDNAFHAQAIDGLSRSAHLQPDHIRGIFVKSLQSFSDHIKRGESVRSSALLINISALLQPTERPVPPSSETAFAALLTDTIPDYRRNTDNIVPAPVPESALMARFDDRLRTDRDRRDPRSDRRDFRPNDRPASRQDARRNYPSDDRAASRYDGRQGVPRSESRNDSRSDDYRASRHSNPEESRDSSVTLADIQKSFASLQSQVDKHTKQVSKPASPLLCRRDRSAYNAHVEDDAEIAFTAIMDANDELASAFRVRQVWSSHPRPLGTRLSDSDN